MFCYIFPRDLDQPFKKAVIELSRVVGLAAAKELKCLRQGASTHSSPRAISLKNRNCHGILRFSIVGEKLSFYDTLVCECVEIYGGSWCVVCNTRRSTSL